MLRRIGLAVLLSVVGLVFGSGCWCPSGYRGSQPYGYSNYAPPPTPTYTTTGNCCP